MSEETVKLDNNTDKINILNMSEATIKLDTDTKEIVELDNNNNNNIDNTNNIFKAAHLLYYASTLLLNVNRLYSDSLLSQADLLLASIDINEPKKFRPAELTPEEEEDVARIIEELKIPEIQEEEKELEIKEESANS